MPRSPRKKTQTPPSASNDAAIVTMSPTPGEINASNTEDLNDEIEQHMVAAQIAELGPFEPEANSTAQTSMPLASITELQGDFPLELGTVEARAEKPDGSSVVVTFEGKKYRRSAAGEPWLDTILLSA